MPNRSRRTLRITLPQQFLVLIPKTDWHHGKDHWPGQAADGK